MPAAQILRSLENPAPSVLQFLEQLERQVNLQTFQPGDGDDGFGTAFGTTTASRRNAKPFIVGFLPPNNVVDFVPVAKVTAEVGSLPTSVNPPRATAAVRIGTKNYGELPKAHVGVDVADLRQTIYNSYVRQTGIAPTENTLGLLTSQVLAENGGAPGAKSFQTNNLNLGNTQASRGGTYASGKDSFANRGGKAGYSRGNPRDGVATDPPKPSGGTYYYGTGFLGDGTAYPVYYTAFKNLDDAVDYHVNQLLINWNGAANAQDVNTFVDGLQNGERGPYFQASKNAYTDSMVTQLSAYRTRFGNQPLGTNPLDPKIAGEDDGSGRKLMTYGTFAGVETQGGDKISDRLGRNIQQADEDRTATANQQTEALRRQIEAIQATSPLLLLINPSEFTRNFEASVDSGVKGRYGNIVHMWLEKPGVISSSGVTAGQYIVDSEGNGGLTNQYRIHSVSYQNLLSLLFTYKNNGILFAGSESDRGIPILACSLFIYYDQHMYIGSFDDFGIQDSGDRPFNMAYSFKFNVRYAFEFDAPFVDSTIADGQRY